METITCVNDLESAIQVLENKQQEERHEMKEAFHDTYEKFQPSNLIKNTIKDVIKLPQSNPEIMKVAIGITVGYLVKKLLVRSSLNPFKLLLGNVLEFAIAGYISRNPEKFKAVATKVAQVLMKIKNRREQKLRTIAIQAG
ncbi:MAG: hypothetical protein JWN78_2913 [Bacteroidota bacterium]|nr:hypothetical protein [Bacteroidota bacterium]